MSIIGSSNLVPIFAVAVHFANGQACELSRVGVGPDTAQSMRMNQRDYLRTLRQSCVVDDSLAGDAVRLSRSSKNCPATWAITCLDHFNCNDILDDVSVSLKTGLASLGFEDIIVANASACLNFVPDCIERQHLVLNANLMNRTWANLLPRTAVLVNLEQLILCSQPKALVAAQLAAQDQQGDEAVVVAGKLAREAALVMPPRRALLGVTVDDYRAFVALDPIGASYPWLEYSYQNADLAKRAGRYCNFLKPIGVSTQPMERNFSFRGNVDFIHMGGITITRRARVLAILENAGWRSVIAEGYFHQARDNILGQATVGINIHRHQRRRIVEVLRLLTYATHGMLIVSEFDRGVDGVSCEIGDMLLESELQNAVVFSSYSLLASCASALLQFNTPAINATKRLATNVARLVDSRQERKLLAPALLSLFPYCNFHGY